MGWCGCGNKDGDLCGCSWDSKTYECPHPAGPATTALYRVVLDADSAWGGWFLVMVSVTLALYVAAGVAMGSQRGLGVSGVRAHPHYQQWLALKGLAEDGVAYTRTRVRGSGTSGGKRSGSASPKGGEKILGKRGEVSRSESKHGKRKHQHKDANGSARENQEDSEYGSVSAGDTHEQLLSSSNNNARPEADVVTAARSSLAGGGGRWVHVPT